MEEKDITKLIDQVSFEDEKFLDKEMVWSKIAEKAEKNRKTGGIRVRLYWATAVSVAAAVCFLFIGLWSIVKVSGGEKGIRYSFPDGSCVELAENSTVRYNKIVWLFSRHVSLKGNADFEVVKHKGIFSVGMDYGTITVLGTHFQVRQGEGRFYVSCTQGCVKVWSKQEDKIINYGEQVEYDGKQMIVTPLIPPDLEFDSTPVTEILSRLETIYGLSVVNKYVCEGYFFTGIISTSNIDEALEVVLHSCDIKFLLDDNVLILNNK